MSYGPGYFPFTARRDIPERGIREIDHLPESAYGSKVAYFFPRFRDQLVEYKLLIDFALLQNCYSGPAIPQTDPGCIIARLDGDDDVDTQDLGIFVGCLSGEEGQPPPECRQ